MATINTSARCIQCRRSSLPRLALSMALVAPSAYAQPTTAIGIPLAPAPSVSSHSPQGRVVAGMNITINGTGFDPATIEVRLGGQKLTLLGKTSTTLVARAPRPEDAMWFFADFRAGQSLIVQTNMSQPRVLNTSYVVLDRWADFRPRLVSMVVSQVAGGMQGDVLNSVSFLGNVTLAGMPGNVFDSLKTGPISGSACAQVVPRSSLPPSETYAASPDGGTLGLSVRFHFDPARIGPCELFLPVALHYSDNPSDVRIVKVNLGTHAVPNPINVLTVSNTAELTSGGFLTFVDPTGSAAWGSCSGTAYPGGPAVGRITVSGDVAFKILTGPAGTTCPWEFTPPRIQSGYNVTYVFSESRSGAKCIVSQNGDPQDGRISQFTFNRLTKFTGWQATPHSTLFGTSDRVQVFLTCALDLNPNASAVVSRLERVEIRAPAGVTDWRTAFIR